MLLHFFASTYITQVVCLKANNKWPGVEKISRDATSKQNLARSWHWTTCCRGLQWSYWPYNAFFETLQTNSRFCGFFCCSLTSFNHLFTIDYYMVDVFLYNQCYLVSEHLLQGSISYLQTDKEIPFPLHICTS